MTTRFRLSILSVFFLGACTLLAQAADDISFEVSYQLQRTAYCSDEPIAVEFKVKNTSTKSVHLFDGGDSYLFYVAFSTKNSSVHKRRSVVAFMEDLFFDGSAIGFEFKPGETLSGYQYVNQDSDYRKPGSYEIDFELGLSYSTAPDTKMAPVFKQTGHFKIDVTDERLSEARLQPILARWSGDRRNQADVMNALSLVDDPLAIPLILKYARQGPGTTKKATRALRKFISRKDGVKALEAMGKEFGPDEKYAYGEYQVPKERDYGGYAARCVFQTFRATERSPSEEFLIEQLTSQNAERVRTALEFLLDARQLANKAPLDEVEKLISHPEKDIAEKARKVLEKMSKEEVKEQF